MLREQMAEACERAAQTPQKSRALLLALASALRAYQAQTHVETYALEEIFEQATTP